MMRNHKYLIGMTAALLLAVGLTSVTYAEPSNVVTKEALLKVLDNPDVVVLDVRRGRDWKSSEFKIKGAVRANPQEFNAWISQHAPDKRFVTYCA